MLFSEHFKVTPGEGDDWFDPILTLDTAVFPDPFLIYADERGPFEGSHDEVINFFDIVFRLLAESRDDPSSVRYQKVLADLEFPEVEELCLGYTAEGTGGSGSGPKLAKLIASGLKEAIQAGLEEITHFEEIGILREKIGADRIGDITAYLLRWRFADYTGEVCRRHGLPTKVYHHPEGKYDRDQKKWVPLDMVLPINPYNGMGILLAPRRYLRALPTINADDFWDYCFTRENATLRAQFSYDVTSRVNKTEIIELARRCPDLLQKYLKDVEGRDGQPYDFEQDSEGFVSWYKPTQEYCTRFPISLVSHSESALVSFLDAVLRRFQHFVELEDGWRLLWNGVARKHEPAAQLLLLGIVKHYCRANGVVVHPEPNIGRGVVTLTDGTGMSLRALLELKLVPNTRFWNALRKGIPCYEKAEKADCCRLIAVTFVDKDADKYIEIGEIASRLKPEYSLKLVRVDASSDDAEAWDRFRPVQYVARDNGVIVVGDGDFTRIDGDVTGSAVGVGASVEAGDVSHEAGA